MSEPTSPGGTAATDFSETADNASVGTDPIEVGAKSDAPVNSGSAQVGAHFVAGANPTTAGADQAAAGTNTAPSGNMHPITSTYKNASVTGSSLDPEQNQRGADLAVDATTPGASGHNKLQGMSIVTLWQKAYALEKAIQEAAANHEQAKTAHDAQMFDHNVLKNWEAAIERYRKHGHPVPESVQADADASSAKTQQHKHDLDVADARLSSARKQLADVLAEVTRKQGVVNLHGTGASAAPGPKRAADGPADANRPPKRPKCQSLTQALDNLIPDHLSLSVAQLEVVYSQHPPQDPAAFAILRRTYSCLYQLEAQGQIELGRGLQLDGKGLLVWTGHDDVAAQGDEGPADHPMSNSDDDDEDRMVQLVNSLTDAELEVKLTQCRVRNAVNLRHSLDRQLREADSDLRDLKMKLQQQQIVLQKAQENYDEARFAM
ncbi:hypothetical protein PG984_011397 [Apiospora sp. TS-2023a]